MEKNIFLDIACFFKWKDGEDVTEILNGCYKGASCGISNLVDKCLINITLSMHDLLREMGWKIVREESKDPGRRSRLWNSKDVYHVLKNNKGTESIEGISLNLSEIGVLQLCPTIFDRMVNLRIIKFYYPSHTKNPKEFKLLLSDRGLKSLPDELRYLHWEYCPLKSFPSNFSPENLIELKLTHCNIEQLWNGDQNVVNLKVVDIEGCKNLSRIQNLLQAINIRKLYIRLCKSLVEIPCLNGLTHLCDLFITECPITQFPQVPLNLEALSLRETQIGEVPSSIGCVHNLEYLNMSRTRIQNLPISIVMLNSLDHIDLSDCFDLNPDSIDSIVAFALLRSQCMAEQLAEELMEKQDGIDDYRGGVICCLPGNGISERFEYQSANSSIIAKLGSKRCVHRGRFLGFILCLVVDVKVSYEVPSDVHCMYQLKTKNGDYHNYKYNLGCPMYDDESIPLEYPKRLLILFGGDMLHEDKQYEEASFRFYFTNYLDENPLDDFKVEKCGVHVFYVDAKGSDHDFDVKSSKRLKSAEKSESSSGSHLSFFQDDGNSCDHDMIQQNYLVEM